MRKFRTIDLLVLTTIAMVLDVVLGVFGLFGLWLYVALSYPLILLCYIRWPKHAWMPNLAIALTHGLMYLLLGHEPLTVLAHGLSVMTLSVAMLLTTWKPMRQRPIEVGHLLLFYLAAYLVVWTSEWLLMLMFGYQVSLGGHAINHSLNVLLGLGLMVMMSRQKDLVVVMERYMREKDED